MACGSIKEKGKIIGFICGGTADDVELLTCHECGNNWPEAEFICDYPVGDDKTCDRMLCKNCARVVGRDMHYCQTHYDQWKTFEESEQGKEQILKAISQNKKIQLVK
ncbi:hypothetical protein NTH44_003596 [Vibrio metoecus]|nr:hypothetical protein [Vibrio cholerae]